MINQTHEAKIKRIQKQLKEYYRQNKKVKIFHGSSNSIRKQTFKLNEIIDISDLNHVLKIDTNNHFAITEPNVPMDTLVEYTLKKGLIPAIVMEFPGITVGGAIQGGASESSAFKYAGFHDICEEYEVLLGNGELIIASHKQNSELFKQIACSYGTLGIITKVKIKLIPSAKYVKLQYLKITSFKHAHDLLMQKSHDEYDYIDAIMWSSSSGVIMIGKLTNEEKLPKATFHKVTDDWFYLHAEKITEKFSLYEEIIPVKDYLFRYDRGSFWVARHAFAFLRIPYTRLTRLLLSWFFTTRNLYRQLHASNLSQRFLIQDFCMPERKTVQFMQYLQDNIQCYPLWLLPINATISTKSIFSPLTNPFGMLINVGVWTEVRDFNTFLRLNRTLEKKVRALGGLKTLYAHAYYTKDEFWQIYDKAAYDSLRLQYKAERTFPNIFDKVVVTEKYKPSLRTALKRVISFKLPVS